MPARTPTQGHHEDALAAPCARLAEVIGRWTRGNEDRATPVPGLKFFRREQCTEPCATLYEPNIVVIAQGAKQLLMGGRSYAYDTGHFLVTSLDLPASSQVLQASPAAPCLGLVLALDLRLTAELIAASGLPPPREPAGRGVAVDGSAALGTVTPALLEPFTRLLALLDEPRAIPVLGPLITREIHYRVLTSDLAARLWRIASVGSQSRRVAKSIDWLKANYRQPLHIDDLAAHVQMSPSSLHHHFRQLTAMSPLQCQKWLRLNEARHLMLNERRNAASAAFDVGYESPSQFNREYARLFGAPPKRDVEGLRQPAADASARREVALL